MTEPCHCELAGWCERHGMAKDEHLLNLCRTREDYRVLWDVQMEMIDKFCGDWQPVATGVFKCGTCGHRAGGVTEDSLPKRKPCRIPKPPPPPPPTHGPGKELYDIFKQLDIPEPPGCGCKAKAAQMNVWGVAGCREHFEEIVVWLRQSYTDVGYLQRATAAKNAVASGLAFSINPFDPVPSLINEAIRRAEEQSRYVDSNEVSA